MTSESPIRRFWDWLRGTDIPDLLPEEVEERDATVPPPKPKGRDHWLTELVSALTEGKRIADVGSEDFWHHVGGLWQSGHEKLALEWLSKFIDAEATPADTVTRLRARLVEMLEKRGDLSPGLEHLEALLSEEEHATRAHFLLAEYYRRRGEEVGALRHYEAVLARDVDYPNARARYERLRKRRGHAAPGSQAATIAGGDALGVGGGARYHLVRELGRGATAVVYLARDTELERDVAVKLLHPHLAASTQKQACAQFFAEARLAASLRHPNIVAILDVDEAARRLVMELAAGGTLRDLLRKGGACAPRRALERHVQLLSALSVAHARGIVHRDVKPGNLMFRRAPSLPGVEVMLGDFGVANLPEGGQHTRDETEAEARVRGDAVGTLAYMPPEQRRGGEVTGRADVYASAVVLYEMLAGRHPLDRRVILGGARNPGDFALPEEMKDAIPAELVSELQAHLDWLSDPDASKRPDADEALAAARKLRDSAWLVD